MKEKYIKKKYGRQNNKTKELKEIGESKLKKKKKNKVSSLSSQKLSNFLIILVNRSNVFVRFYTEDLKKKNFFSFKKWGVVAE